MARSTGVTGRAITAMASGGYVYPDWAVQNRTTSVAEFQLVRADGPVVGGRMLGGSVLIAITIPPGSMYTEVFPLGREITGLCLERVRLYRHSSAPGGGGEPTQWEITACYPDGVPGRREQWMFAGNGRFFRIRRHTAA